MSAPGASPQARLPAWHLAATAAVVAAGLAMVLAVQASGQGMLALAMLVLLAMLAGVYTVPRLQAWRYVFPGVAAALVFVVFPMAYTVGLGFTNQSSQNLLPPERAHAVLAAETAVTPGSARPFHLVAEGGALRLWLPATAAANAATATASTSAAGEWLSPPLPAAGSAAPDALGMPALPLTPLRVTRIRIANLRFVEELQHVGHVIS